MLTDQNKQFLDSGEGVVLHFTLLPFLGKTPIKITKAAISSIAGIEKQLQARFHDFLNTPKFKKVDLNFSKVSFDDAQSAVSRVLDVEQLGSILPEMENEMLASSISDIIVRLQSRLQQVLPRKPVRANFQPSDFIAADFLRQFRTINNPMTVVDDLEMGCLSNSQVLVLMEVYPSLYNLVNATFIESVVEMTTSNPEFAINYPKLKQSAILLQNPLASEDLQSLLQSNFQDETEKQPAGKDIEVASAQLTQSQKMESK